MAAARGRQIYGIGTDIVSVSRVKQLVEKYGDQFLAKAYHPKEIETFSNRASQQSRFEFLASRWAVKEATQKALSSPRLLFPEMYVNSGGNGGGKGTGTGKSTRPVLEVEGSVQTAFSSAGVCRSHVSMSHEEGRAVATVVLEEYAS